MLHGGTARYFDISPDGQTFVLIEQDYEAPRQASLRVITGFDRLLRGLR